MSMRIEPLQPDLLIAIYAIHKFYKELGKNPEWLTKKEQFKKKTIGENRCGELEYEVVSPILWDCVSFFFEEESVLSE